MNKEEQETRYEKWRNLIKEQELSGIPVRRELIIHNYITKNWSKTALNYPNSALHFIHETFFHFDILFLTHPCDSNQTWWKKISSLWKHHATQAAHFSKSSPKMSSEFESMAAIISSISYCNYKSTTFTKNLYCYQTIFVN